MLTPRFSLSQCWSTLCVTIHAPFTNVSETTIFFSDREFIFHSKPYYLRLHLPCSLVDSDLIDSDVAEYRAEDNSFVVKAPKAVEGQVFPNLDALSLLLKPSKPNKVHHIQMVDNNEEDNEDTDDSDQWLIEQQLVADDNTEKDVEHSKRINEDSQGGYGFAYAFSQVFTKISDECASILDVSSPDSKSFEDRVVECTNMELRDFDAEHYLADLMDPPPELKMAIDYKEDKNHHDHYTEEEQIRLMNARGKDLLSPSSRLRNLTMLALMDVLFASCFDVRQNGGERSSESAWNITKLSAFLSCCIRFESLQSCVHSGLRRSLTYALYRHFDLAMEAYYDVVRLLKRGRIAVIKHLLALMPLMTEYEGRFIINQIVLEPYVVWLQGLKEEKLFKAAEKLDICLEKTTKKDLGLALEEVEALVGEDEGPNTQDIGLITDKLRKVYVADSDDESEQHSEDDTSDSTDSDDDSSSGSDDESSTDSDDSDSSDTSSEGSHNDKEKNGDGSDHKAEKNGDGSDHKAEKKTTMSSMPGSGDEIDVERDSGPNFELNIKDLAISPHDKE